MAINMKKSKTCNKEQNRSENIHSCKRKTDNFFA